MRLLAAILFLVICGGTSAQDHAFQVLISKGENEIKGKHDWEALKTGATLQAGDEVKVSENGYLALVHSSGRPLEVKDPGPYKVMDLASRVKGSTSVLKKYTDFILSTKTNNNTSMTATGAVHRGPGQIKVFLPKPEQAFVFNDEISIVWATDPEIKAYEVRFSSMFGDQLNSFAVQDTALSINLSTAKFRDEDNIVVTIAAKDDPQVASENFILKKLSGGDKKRLTASLAEMATLTRDRNALNLLYLASFYEENGLLIDASTAFLQAIRLAPDVPYYRQAYYQYVLRNSFRN